MLLLGAMSADPDPPHRVRQLRLLRRLTDLNMDLAEDAAAKLDGVGLARQTRVVTHLFSIENRTIAGDDFVPAARKLAASASADPRFQRSLAADPRRNLLRQTLHEAAKVDPDRASRNQLCRMANERIDEELIADPAQDLTTLEILRDIADDLGLKINTAKLSDAVLGIKPPIRKHPDHPLYSPVFAPEDPRTHPNNSS